MLTASNKFKWTDSTSLKYINSKKSLNILVHQSLSTYQVLYFYYDTRSFGENKQIFFSWFVMYTIEFFLKINHDLKLSNN